MDDFSLLKLAAKAAGYEINFEEPCGNWFAHGYDDDGDPHAWWNPLLDDGDALRLAVKLGMTIKAYGRASFVAASTVAKGETRVDRTPGDDPCVAMRRAIVRAAAALASA